MKKYDWSEERIRTAVMNADSYSDTLRNLNIPVRGNNNKTLKSKLSEYNIDISHFTFRTQYITGRENKKYTPVSLYLHKGTNIKSYKLKEKLIKEGIKENKCENLDCPCNTGYWRNNILTCQLHHIDGDSTNNELSNLIMLCPNCHSQTENFCGNANRKKINYCKDCNKVISFGSTYCKECKDFHSRKVERPNKEQLCKEYKETHNFSELGRRYNVSDNTIRKWFKYYKIERDRTI